MRETGSLLVDLGVPKNEPGLKVLLALNEENMCPVHKQNKQTESVPQIAYY